LVNVIPIIAALLSFSPLSLSDQVLSYGIWAYLLVFFVITFTSTIIGGPIPDNTFLILIGAATVDNGMSMEGLLVVAVLGGFVGYEINYWSGRRFGLKICRGACPLILHDKNVRKALDMMDRSGPASMILSRFMPVLNLPSFIAGVTGMEYRRYVVFNLVSSIVWCITFLVLGYYIGNIAVISGYLDILTDVFLVIMVVAIIIVLVMFVRDYMGPDGNHSPE
jgi:membrane-associated protein